VRKPSSIPVQKRGLLEEDVWGEVKNKRNTEKVSWSNRV